MHSKRLSTILREGKSRGSKEVKEVPTPFGGVYRRQNFPHTTSSSRQNNAKIERADIIRQAKITSQGTALVMKKSNKAGRQTRRVLSHVDKLLPLMHNLLGALQSDSIEPRPYTNRRDSWAAAPRNSRNRIKEAEEKTNHQAPMQEEKTMQLEDVQKEDVAVRRGTFVQLNQLEDDATAKEEKSKKSKKS